MLPTRCRGRCSPTGCAQARSDTPRAAAHAADREAAGGASALPSDCFRAATSSCRQAQNQVASCFQRAPAAGRWELVFKGVPVMQTRGSQLLQKNEP